MPTKNASQKLLWFGAMMTGPSSGIRSTPLVRSPNHRRMNGVTSALMTA